MKTRRNANALMVVVRLLTTICVLVYALVPPFAFCTCRGICLAAETPSAKAPAAVEKACCARSYKASLAGRSSCERCRAVEQKRACCEKCESKHKRGCKKQNCCVSFNKTSALTAARAASVRALDLSPIFFAAAYVKPTVSESLLDCGRAADSLFPLGKLRIFLCVWRN